MKTTDKSVWESGEKRINLTLGTIAEVTGAVLPEGVRLCAASPASGEHICTAKFSDTGLQ